MWLNFLQRVDKKINLALCNREVRLPFKNGQFPKGDILKILIQRNRFYRFV
jgi:hypothetical protein